MSIYKWTKNALVKMKEQNYVIIPCKSEKETEQIKSQLKENKRRSQGGYAINKDNKKVYFVLTKKK